MKYYKIHNIHKEGNYSQDITGALKIGFCADNHEVNNQLVPYEATLLFDDETTVEVTTKGNGIYEVSNINFNSVSVTCEGSWSLEWITEEEA